MTEEEVDQSFRIGRFNAYLFGMNLGLNSNFLCSFLQCNRMQRMMIAVTAIFRRSASHAV